jgi:hypothetical protein
MFGVHVIVLTCRITLKYGIVLCFCPYHAMQVLSDENYSLSINNTSILYDCFNCKSILAMIIWLLYLHLTLQSELFTSKLTYY